MKITLLFFLGLLSGATLRSQIDWSTCVPKPTAVVNSEIIYHSVVAWDTAVITLIDSSSTIARIDLSIYEAKAFSNFIKDVALLDGVEIAPTAIIRSLNPNYGICAEPNTVDCKQYFIRIEGATFNGENFTAIGVAVVTDGELKIIQSLKEKAINNSSNPSRLVKNLNFRKFQSAFAASDNKLGPDLQLFGDCEMLHLQGLYDIDCILSVVNKNKK
ncbi:hypothetical protein [Neolewinella antarctica]|uniref:Uncharacterized protein n=1 Tax=Neolewinella antarctica TaxID=442734 RepID=A0ABX0XEH2_9BACT|nr:hypothetical protein [Neolewinella antarctica]NJC27690.1 hypothetical protein [Neolewinella antarctica]